MRPLAPSILLVLAFLSTKAFAGEPESAPGFPTGSPVRERVFSADDQAGWTLRKGESAVPLAVVPTPNRTAVALAGGWVFLGPDLDILPSSYDFLAPDQPAGSPWAQAYGDAVLFVTSSPGDLAVIYPGPAVILKQKFDLKDLTHFTLTDQGFLYVESRRTSGAPTWGRPVREGQPLLFFPADLTSAPDGTGWAADSLQARPWRVEDGFWKPLDFPKAPGRMSSLSPFPDSTGYFATGPGWVGAFSADGTPFWVRDTDLSGKSLPRDLRVRTGAGRLYLWSAQSRRVWCWGWDSDGPAGVVAAPAPALWADMVNSEIDRLEALGSVPEALSVAQYGAGLALSVLKSSPFDKPWTGAFAGFKVRAQGLKDRVVGAGVLTLGWADTEGSPVASWTWEPDASWSDVKIWKATLRPWWEGRPYDSEEFKLALAADHTPWPGVETYLEGDLNLPSWMNIDLWPGDGKAPVHWCRVPLPAPPVPYELPVE